VCYKLDWQKDRANSKFGNPQMLDLLQILQCRIIDEGKNDKLHGIIEKPQKTDVDLTSQEHSLPSGKHSGN